MSSLKRLLNPSTDDTFPHHRPQTAWDDYGLPIDPDPVLPKQPWADYVDELLGQNAGYDDFGQDIGESFGQDVTHDSQTQDAAPVYFAQELAEEQIEQWAAQNMPLQMTAVTPSPDAEYEQICYGMIYRAAVKLRGNMGELDSKLNAAGGQPLSDHCEMGISKPDEQYVVTFPDGLVMGELNGQLEKAFESMNASSHQVIYEVLAPIRAIRETIGRATKEKDAIVRVNINLYGPRNLAHQIGRELSNHKVYLQRPDYWREVPYDNPHVLKLSNVQTSYNESSTRVEEEKMPEAAKAEAFKKTISDVYSSLKRGHKLVGLEGDDRLKTSLLLHQKEALEFMSQRENGPIPDEFLLWRPDEVDGQRCHRHVLTNAVSRMPRVETGGGILADEMGMGKTLSILALVLRTLEKAHEWASEATARNDIGPEVSIYRKIAGRSRATLVIASSDLMINEWMQEMNRHFDQQMNKVLKTIKYHGQDREKDVEKLRDADLIITTYHTLASDFATRRHPLNEIEWYRLVLDEAHIIRRQSTGLYRTVAQLRARSRWCLTGTPIQNRLEDIGSLFAFIRANPFHSMSTFRKYIAIPFDEGEQRKKIAIERFTRLLDSLCLRRTKDLLHLPDQRDRVRSIHFSEEERLQYEQTKNMMFRAAHNQVGIFDSKSTLGMFQVNLQLRILCNHGTFQQPFSWNRRKLQLQDEREALEMSLGREGEVTCTNCHTTMPMFGTGLYKRYTEHCKHVICFECIQDSLPSTQESNSSDLDGFPDNCPLCAPVWGRMGNGSQPLSQSSAHSGDQEVYFRPYGRSSKMEALLADVRTDLWTTKSILFSCWTHTLDLIQNYLSSANIVFKRNFQRIDGECPTAKREKILDDFARNPNMRVLIMTTGTGAVGLNLATANRVFIVEPQWNPSVENQAIARALRLGQEQDVQVTRYVVEKTVEQEMRTLQDRKLETAGIAWK